MFLPALVLVMRDVACGDKTSPSGVIGPVGVFIVSFAALTGLSYACTGYTWDFVFQTFGTLVTVPDLTPNIGLFWYYFMEMFDSFRAFFLFVFQMHLLGYVAPITMRFQYAVVSYLTLCREQPLFAIFLLMTITATFHPYPTLGDAAVYLPFVFMYPEIFKRTSLVQSSRA
jgi:phosphatidylinositol glycan class U